MNPSVNALVKTPKASVNTLENTFNTIWHFADLHFVKNNREDEYKHVIDETIKTLNARITSSNARKSSCSKISPIIVICGDLFDNCVKITEPSIRLLLDFIKQLLKIAPVVVIPGNHDISKFSKYDASKNNILNTLLSLIESDNLYYINNSKSLVLGNLKLNSLDVSDIERKDVDIDNILSVHAKNPDNKINILLSHISLSTSNATTEMTSTSDKTATDTATTATKTINIYQKIFPNKHILTKYNFDLYLLGDLHIPGNFLQHNMAYPGSLLQLNHGETINHGFIEWTITSTKNGVDVSGKFIKVNNKYGFVTVQFEDISNKDNIEIDKDKLNKVLSKYPKNINLRLLNIPDRPDINVEYFKHKISEYLDNNTLKTIKYEYDSIDSSTDSSVDNVKIVPVLNFKDWLYNEVKQKNIKNIHNINDILSLHANYSIFSEFEYNTIELKYLKLEKFAIHNHLEINFDDYNTTTCIFGDNATGKTTILKSILFVIYGDPALYLNMAINKINDKKFNLSGTVTLKLLINNVQYTIVRKKTTTKHSILIYKQDNIYLDTLKSCEEFLKSIFNEREVALSTWILMQNDINDFLSLTPSEKNLLFQKILIKDTSEVFSDIKHNITSINSKINSNKTYIDDLLNDIKITKTSLESEDSIENIENLIMVKTKKLDTIKEKLYKIEEKYKSIKNITTDQIEQYKNKIKTKPIQVSFSPNTLKKLENEKNSLPRYVNKNINVDDCKAIIRKTLESLKKLTTIQNIPKFHETSKDELETKKIAKNTISINIENTIQNISKCNKNILIQNQQYKKFNENKRKYKFSDSCDSCTFNKNVLNFSKEYENEIIDNLLVITNELKTNEDAFKTLNIEYNNVVNDISNIEKIIEDISCYNRCKEDISTFENNKKLDILAIKINNEYALQDRFIKYQNEINEYNEIQKLVTLYNEFINENKSINITEKDDITKELHRLNSTFLNIKTLHKTLSNLNDKLAEKTKEFKNLKSKKVLYDTYKQCLEMYINYNTTNKISKFNKLINNLLINYGLKVQIIKNETQIFLNCIRSKDIIPCGQISGSERFLLTIAIRCGLASISTIFVPNCIFIDEGFGSLDPTRVDKIKTEILPILNQCFNKIFIITHIPVIQSYCSNIINLNNRIKT